MLSSDQHIDKMARIVQMLRHYADLRLECLQIDLVSKTTRLLSVVTLGGLMVLALSAVVLFLSLSLGFYLAPHVGGLALAFAFVALLHALGILGLWRYRSTLIAQPLASILSQILLDDPTVETTAADNETTTATKEEMTEQF